MARCISFVNFKGGVGKTSLSVNIAAHLARNKGRRTLLVDMDPQSNASQWLLRYELWKKINDMAEHSVYSIFMNTDRNVGQNLISAPVKRDDGQVEIGELDILPSCYKLMDLEHEYRERPGVPYYQHFLNEIGIFFPHYDFVIFDCPPNLYRGTACAIFASTEIYVPCNPDILSYAGLAYLVQKLKKLKESVAAERAKNENKPFAAIRGIIMNDGNPRANYDDIHTQFEAKIAEIRHNNGDIVFPDVRILSPMVRSYEAARKAAYLEKPVSLMGNSPLAEDYAAIGDYINSLAE